MSPGAAVADRHVRKPLGCPLVRPEAPTPGEHRRQVRRNFVVRFGPQIRADGVNANSETAGKLIGYLTKYLTKTLDACLTVDSDRQRAHVDRLAAALRPWRKPLGRGDGHK